MDKDLLEIFKNVKEWLNHAESKNAMLIAFNGAAIFGLIQLKDIEIIFESSFLTHFLVIAVGSLVISLLFSFLSFVPKLKIIPKSSKLQDRDDINAFYFEHLKELNKESIFKEITGFDPDLEKNRIELDLAEQIQQISIIASRKYVHFTIAIWITSGVFSVSLLVGILVIMIQSSCY